MRGNEYPPPADHRRPLPRARKLDPPTDRLVLGYAESRRCFVARDEVSTWAGRLKPVSSQYMAQGKNKNVKCNSAHHLEKEAYYQTEAIP